MAASPIENASTYCSYLGEPGAGRLESDFGRSHVTYATTATSKIAIAVTSRIRGREMGTKCYLCVS